MTRPHRILALAGIIIAAPAVLALAPGNWFDADAPDLDRMIEPVGLPDAVHAGALGLAVLVLVAGIAVVAAPPGRRSARRQDLAVAAPLLAAALYVAFTYRVVTAGVIGANIGGGILLLQGAVLVPALLGVSIYAAWRSQRGPSVRP